MSKVKSTFIGVNPRLIQIPEAIFNEKSRLIRAEIGKKFDYFIQNKPNFLQNQMNVRFFYTKDYENISARTLGENKPNQTQFQIARQKRNNGTFYTAHSTYIKEL